MLIGELSDKSGFSVDTIRFYEKTGLIDASRIERRSNAYKEYSPAVLKRLLAIRDLKDFGFTLKEIQETIALYEKDPASCAKNVPKLKAKRTLIDRKINHLLALQEKLKQLEVACETDCAKSCGIQTALYGIRESSLQ